MAYILMLIIDFTYRCALSGVGLRVCCHVFVSCRCSREDKMVPSTSTATGPATRKDSATWMANSGLVGKYM